jgi:PEP-CTERM motif
VIGARSVSAFLVVLLTVASAGATPITVASDPALLGSTVIDFDSEPDSSFLSKTISGVTFTAVAGLLSIADYTSGGIYGGSGKDLEASVSTSAFRIDFATPVSAFGTVWGGANEDWTVRLFDSGNVLLETMVFLGGDGALATYIEFYGAQNTDIKSVTFDIIPGFYGTDWVKLDNFQFVPSVVVDPQPVPEPATMLLLGGGLAAIAARRRQTSAQLGRHPACASQAARTGL